MSDTRVPRQLHHLAIATVAAAFPLIFMGGLVTTKGAGLAVPDWPNTYGYNMFLFPPSKWVGGVFYEHVHRLLGMLVGFLAVLMTLAAFAPARNPGTRRWIGVGAVASIFGTIAMSAMLLALPSREQVSGIQARVIAELSHATVGVGSLALILAGAYYCRDRQARRWVRWLTVGVLVGVIIQGVLGGLRVTETNTELAIIHGIFAQAFLCLTASVAVVTSRHWLAASVLPADPGARRIATVAAVSLGLLFAQLIVGALMRHYQAGLAIPDLPLAYGRVLPPTDASGLSAINDYRAQTLGRGPVTLGQIWLHFGHRLGAIVVSVALLTLIVSVLRRSQLRGLATLAWLLGVMLVMQLTLGVFVVLKQKPADVTSGHVAVGALILLITFVLAMRAARLGCRQRSSAAAPQPSARAGYSMPRAATA